MTFDSDGSGLEEKKISIIRFIYGITATAVAVSGIGFAVAYRIYVEPIEVVKESYISRIADLEKKLLGCAKSDMVFDFRLDKGKSWRTQNYKSSVTLKNVEESGTNDRAQIQCNIKKPLPQYVFA